MKISVVIPAHQAAQTIGRALDSVLSQTRAPDEIVVVDDGSVDGTADVVRSVSPTAIVVRSVNGGPGAARNIGLDTATGAIVAFLDADDWWEPHKLLEQESVVRRFPDVAVVAGMFYSELAGRPRWLRPLHVRDEECDRPLHPTGNDLLRLAFSCTSSTTAIRRDKLPAERFDASLTTAGDRDFWIRAIRRGAVCFLRRPLATTMVRPDSHSNADLECDVGCMLQVLHRYADILTPKELRRWEARVYRKLAGGLLHRGRGRAGVAPAIEWLRREPFNARAWWIGLRCVASVSQRTRGRPVGPPP